jgi:hypothetical protein
VAELGHAWQRTPADSLNHRTDVEDADTRVVEGNRIVDDYFSKITLNLGCSKDAIAGVIHFSGGGIGQHEGRTRRIATTA